MQLAIQNVEPKESEVDTMRNAVDFLEKQAELLDSTTEKIYPTTLEGFTAVYRAFYAHTICSLARGSEVELVEQVDRLRLLAFPNMKQQQK